MFTVPTISNDLAPVEPVTSKPNPEQPAFHEDDWCQVEFYPRSYLPELQRMLQEYKTFELANRQKTTIQGKDYWVWRNTYVRKVVRNPLIAGSAPLPQLESTLGAKAGPAPVLYSSGALTGRVREGFTLPLGGNVILYGYQNSGQIPVLGALVGNNPDNQVLTKAFEKLHAAYGLVLVDWRSQFILVSSSEGGKLDLWSPP